MFVDVEGCHWGILSIDVPEFHGHVVTREDVPPIGTESDVRDAGDDLGEEGFVGLGLHFLKSLGMSVAEGGAPHVCQPDAAFAAAIGEDVAV